MYCKDKKLILNRKNKNKSNFKTENHQNERNSLKNLNK